MSRDNYDVRSDYIGDGTLNTYTFDFKITDLTQLLIKVWDATGVQTYNMRGDDPTFTVTFDPKGGGRVVLPANLAAGVQLTLLLADDQPIQPSRFNTKETFSRRGIEEAIDRLAGAVQRVSYMAKRAVRVGDRNNVILFDPLLPSELGEPATPTELIPVTSTTGLGWGPIGSWIKKVDLQAAFAAALQAVASAAASASAAAASAGSAAASAASTQDSSAQAAAAAASATIAVNAKNDAQTAATAAAGSASAATGQATSAAGSATAAQGFSTAAGLSATNAANSQAAAATSETNAGNSAAAAAASAASVGNFSPTVVGSRAIPSNISAAGGIAFTGTAWYTKWFIKGTSGAIDVTKNPQIDAGQAVGQRLSLQGRSNVDTVLLEDGTGLSLNGAWVAGADNVLNLDWDGTNWVENSRS